jgi:hypothetical protein
LTRLVTRRLLFECQCVQIVVTGCGARRDESRERRKYAANWRRRGGARREGSEVATGRSAGAWWRCDLLFRRGRRSAAAGGALCDVCCVRDARATTLVVTCKRVSGCCATQRRVAGARKCHVGAEWSEGAVVARARGARHFSSEGRVRLSWRACLDCAPEEGRKERLASMRTKSPHYRSWRRPASVVLCMRRQGVFFSRIVGSVSQPCALGADLQPMVRRIAGLRPSATWGL